MELVRLFELVCFLFPFCEIYYESRVMALDLRKPNILTKSQGDGKVVHFHIFRQKVTFWENRALYNTRLREALMPTSKVEALLALSRFL